MKFRTCAVAVGTTLLMGAVLSGCGGGGGGSTSASTGTVVTVSPSLGKFSKGAKVTLKKPDGTNIATAETTDAGTASVNVGSYTGALVIEVAGATGVKYYDEGIRSDQDFGVGQVLRAIAPSVQTAVGVTPATHAAVESIKDSNGNIPSNITAADIGDANAKIATALGISDVLQAPKLVDINTTATLDVANLGDKYALQLAALAKLAGANKTALDVAKEIAKDLKDGKLDGKEGTDDIPNRSTDYTADTIKSKMAAKLKDAATQLGSDNTKTLADADPAVLGTVNNDVTKVKAPIDGVKQAKAMFAELRTTLKSFSNASQKGFLDMQAQRASDDMKLVVTPEADKLSLRLSTIGLAVRTFEEAQTVTDSTNDTRIGAITIPGLETAKAWINRFGSTSDVVNGFGDRQTCFVALPASSSSLVTCLSAKSGAVANGKIKFTKYVLTPTGSGAYSYAAERENRGYNPTNFNIGSASPPSVAIPKGQGTVTKSSTNSFTMEGTLPPTATYADGDNAGDPSTGVDTVALSATRSALAKANSYRYALAGSVATTSLASNKTVTLSLDTGSYLEIDESSATGSQGPKMLALNLVGTVKTAATQLTGTLAMLGITSDSSGTQSIPSSMVLSGAISDLTSKGAGEFLNGKLEATTTGYSAFDATAAVAGNNFVHSKVTFTGTVQAPDRPALKLVLSATATGPDASSVTLNYSYGAVSITGSGSSTASSSTFTISNQDGIQIAANPKNPHENLITKASTQVASFSDGVINYVDGASESFN